MAVGDVISIGEVGYEVHIHSNRIKKGVGEMYIYILILRHRIHGQDLFTDCQPHIHFLEDRGE
jgi:hypothetical protein